MSAGDEMVEAALEIFSVRSAKGETWSDALDHSLVDVAQNYLGVATLPQTALDEAKEAVRGRPFKSRAERLFVMDLALAVALSSCGAPSKTEPAVVAKSPSPDYLDAEVVSDRVANGVSIMFRDLGITAYVTPLSSMDDFLSFLEEAIQRKLTPGSGDEKSLAQIRRVRRMRHILMGITEEVEVPGEIRVTWPGRAL